tara:strand:- start:1177 stop:1668 length:492 start_codon:yes stop_codon:yes gene_type:complete
VSNKKLNTYDLPQKAIIMALSKLESSDDNKASFGLITTDLSGDVYAIKESHFPLIQTAITVVAGFLGTGVSFAPAGIAALLILLVYFYKKNIKLNAIQGVLIQELKDRPGMTSDQLIELCSDNVKKDVVEEELENLTAIPDSSGNLHTIVRIDKDKRWYLVDI